MLRWLHFLDDHPLSIYLAFISSYEGGLINRHLNGNHINMYRHVAVVHEYVWRTLCSVCATGARVAQPVLCNS